MDSFKTLFIITITVLALLSIAIVSGAVWGISKISKHGLKGCVERVWNGPNTNNTVGK